MAAHSWPAITSDGKNVFVAWPEYLPNRPPLLFAKKWDGSRKFYAVDFGFGFRTSCQRGQRTRGLRQHHLFEGFGLRIVGTVGTTGTVGTFGKAGTSGAGG